MKQSEARHAFPTWSLKLETGDELMNARSPGLLALALAAALGLSACGDDVDDDVEIEESETGALAAEED